MVFEKRCEIMFSCISWLKVAPDSGNKVYKKHNVSFYISFPHHSPGKCEYSKLNIANVTSPPSFIHTNTSHMVHKLPRTPSLFRALLLFINKLIAESPIADLDKNLFVCIAIQLLIALWLRNESVVGNDKI